ncbi:MAG: endonuclease [Bacteroidaceae bacterium]|nr:endonuclease [Bacteroidaceae bacterium]
MKRTFIFIWTLLIAAVVAAQIPSGYYNNANGKKKDNLKSAMHGIIAKAKVLDYGSGAGSTWEGFYSTDRYDDNKVRDRYSNQTFYFGNKGSAASGMNIEHSFPKSWWGGTQNQAYKDLYNLMPSEQKINSSKSNYAMGKVNTVKVDNNCTKVGTGTAGSKNANLWEPADKWKGDFARSYFYMVTCYSNFTWEGEGLTMLENNEWPTLQKWAYELFVQWNREDPVDQIERDRNEEVYKIQGNRNPFVDFPNLCEYIWGDSINVAFNAGGGGGGEDPEPGSFMAYDAMEIVCSINSCRFDANWAKYKEGAEYTLDVYTKDPDDGTKSSLIDYPITTTNNTHRVTGLKPNTTYYYTVYVYEYGKCIATSNEVRVDMPDIQPIFTASETQITLSALPGQPSQKQEIKLTLMAVKEYKVDGTCDAPFEISADGETWSNTLTLTGSSPFLYVRLSAQEEEGAYTGMLTLKCLGCRDIEIPLSAQVNEQMAFLETFEKGSKGSYAVGTVECAAATWRMSDALIGKDVKANDLNSARIKGGGYIEMQEDKLLGCDSIWFYAAPYGSDSNMALTVSYSLDKGETWQNVVEDLSLGNWQRYGYKIGKDGNIRLKITGVGAKRINIDDIQMSDYKEETDVANIRDLQPTADIIYDLAGRRVQRAGRHGIYIVNGKKVVR